MRWVRFQHDRKVAFGILEGEEITPVTGSPFGTYERCGKPIPFSSVELLAPVIPPTFYAAGMNYAGHTEEMAGQIGDQAKKPAKPDIGYRANNALIGPDKPIVVPKDSSGRVQYEPELVAVIGKETKYISEKDALSCVFGYTIGNDVSERTWQKSDRTLWRAKNSDTFKPMGPWIETELDLDKLITRVRLNGKEVAEFPTNQMVFGVARYISEISRFITLYPGDVIWMGADSPTKDMVPGDVVEIDITGLGTLRNPVVAEADRA
jgi:2-keto-4-pentenoate hydratase/2-oxohepta-3-ene-1,7-dioic acid hydratase in catechol pathway